MGLKEVLDSFGIHDGLDEHRTQRTIYSLDTVPHPAYIGEVAIVLLDP